MSREEALYLIKLIFISILCIKVHPRNVRYEKFPVSVYRKNYTDISFPLIIIKENSLMEFEGNFE